MGLSQRLATQNFQAYDVMAFKPSFIFPGDILNCCL